jgi:hypothetical protein
LKISTILLPSLLPRNFLRMKSNIRKISRIWLGR